MVHYNDLISLQIVFLWLAFHDDDGYNTFITNKGVRWILWETH